MLYVTTRTDHDPQTAFHALTEERGECGGLYLPMHLPTVELPGLRGKSFGAVVADILNLFFPTHLTGWDVDFCIGRYPVRLIFMSHRMVLTETWYNPDWDFSRTVRELTALISGNQSTEAGSWCRIALRIAVLFGTFVQMMESGELKCGEKADVSVPSGDFSAPMAAILAREMGLPIANVVVCCNENSAPWDLLCKGELRTGTVAIRTALPECDHVVPEELERFIHFCGGQDAVAEYLHRARQGGVYFPDEDTLGIMRSSIHVSVVSSKRILSSIPNICKTNGKILGPYAALTWCGLMDYRARTGESRLSLVLSDKSPQADLKTVADAMGIGMDELNLRI